jgi:hypothetical protein
MGAVPNEKAGVGSAINDATRLFGATLGVAVIGSIAASLYAGRVSAAIPHATPFQAAAAAKGSVGAALGAAHLLGQAGRVITGHLLASAATDAFLHAMGVAIMVAGLVALGGAVLAAAFLPARPGQIGPGRTPRLVEGVVALRSNQVRPADDTKLASEPIDLDSA